MKWKRVLWPCEKISEGMVRLLDEACTEIKVAEDLLKFKPLAKVAKSRSAEWRRAYAKALSF